MPFTTKGITIEINGNTTGFDKALRRVKSKVQGVDHEMQKLSRSMKSGGSSATTFAAYQDLATVKLKNFEEQLALNRGWADRLSREYEKSCEKTSAYSKESIALKENIQYLNAEAGLLEDQIQRLSSSMLTCSPAMQRMYAHLNNIAESAERAYQTLKPISLLSFASLLGATAAAISFEDAWAGVTKTVEGTPQQMQAVNDGLKELALNTASSYESLAGYAELAGQMGVATDSVLGFTKTVAMLGDTTNVAGEDAAQALAQVANIMVDAEDRTTDYYERFGSTLVDLGNNFATTEDDIVQIVQKLAVAGRQVGMTTPQVMALGTALSSMGIKANAGGSSMSKLMKEIQIAVSTGSDDLQKYADTAGMSAEQFATAWRDDAGTAFMTFLQGVGQADDVTAKLDELGITEVRMSNAAGALAQSTDVYTTALARADKAWESNTAMVQEAEKRYGTMKTSLSQTFEAIKQAGNEIGETLYPVVRDILDGVKNLALAFTNMDDGTKRMVTSLLVAATSLAPIAKLTQGAAKGTNKLIKAFGGIASAVGGFAKGVVSGGDAVASFGTALAGLTTPTGWITTGIIALGGALVGLNTYFKLNREAMLEDIKAKDEIYQINEELIDQAEKHIEASNDHIEAAQRSIDSYGALKMQTEDLTQAIGSLLEKEHLSAYEKQMLGVYVDRLNALYPELGISVDENTGKIKTNTGEVFNNTEELKKNIEAQEEAAKKRYFAQAMDEGYQAISESTSALEKSNQTIESMKRKMRELSAERTALNHKRENGLISQSDFDKQSALIDEHITLYKEQMQEAQEVSAEAAQAIGDHWKEMILAMNQSETGGLDTMGESVKGAFTDLENRASEAGYNIPNNLAEFMNNNSTLPVDAAEMMGSLITFESGVDKAGLYGGLIDSNLAMSVIGSAGTITEAINGINNIIEFTQACQEAGVSGKQIADNLTENMLLGIATGQLAKDEAIKGMMGKIDATSLEGDYGFAAGKKVTDNVAKGIDSGSASVGASGEKMNKILNPALGKVELSAETSGKYASKKFRNQIDPALPNAATNAIRGAENAFSGSVLGTLAANVASAATSSFAQQIARIPQIAQQTYSTTKTWIDKTMQLTQQTFSVNVQRNVKTVNSEENKRQSAPRLRTMSANSFSPSMVSYASNAISPVSSAVQEAMGYNTAKLSAMTDSRMNTLSAKIDGLVSVLNNDQSESYLKIIAANSEKDIIWNNQVVAKLVAKPVQEINNGSAKFMKRMGGQK